MPTKLERCMASLILYRFKLKQGMLFYVSKSRLIVENSVLTEEEALDAINEINISDRYVVIVCDSKALPRAEYLMIKASVIRRLGELSNPIRGSRYDLVYYDDPWR
jgi:hypothetical protein